MPHICPPQGKINLAWLNTAFSSGFRAVEIPFLISFVSGSLNQQREISMFGAVIAVVVASSGLLLSFATPTSCGAKPADLNRLFFLLTGSSILIALILLSILYAVNPNLLDTDKIPITIAIIIAGIVSISLRRIYQGALIYIHRSGVILVSALSRVLFSISLCLLLPKETASGMTALYIVVFAAILDTLMNMGLYRMYKARIPVQYKETVYSQVSGFLSVSITSVAYTVQNYLIILLLTIMHRGQSIDDWIIIYSFISIFTGVYLDIENIVARFRLDLSNIFHALLMPLALGLVLFSIFLLIPFGRNLYFVGFQGMANMASILRIRWIVAAIIAIFLVKQFLKGCLIHEEAVIFLKKSAFMSILGILVTGFILYLFKSSVLLITASVVYLGSLLFEFLCLVRGYSVTRRQRGTA